MDGHSGGSAGATAPGSPAFPVTTSNRSRSVVQCTASSGSRITRVTACGGLAMKIEALMVVVIDICLSSARAWRSRFRNLRFSSTPILRRQAGGSSPGKTFLAPRSFQILRDPVGAMSSSGVASPPGEPVCQSGCAWQRSHGNPSNTCHPRRTSRRFLVQGLRGRGSDTVDGRQYRLAAVGMTSSTTSPAGSVAHPDSGPGFEAVSTVPMAIAHSVSPASETAQTSPVPTAWRWVWLTTRPRATSRSPRVGRRKLILYSAVKTDTPRTQPGDEGDRLVGRCADNSPMREPMLLAGVRCERQGHLSAACCSRRQPRAEQPAEGLFV